MYSSKYFDHLVVFTAGIGMFLSTLDSGIINVALPTLSKYFNVDTSFITWSVTLYTLLLTGTIIIFGRLSDKYSRLNIYSLGLTIFNSFYFMRFFKQRHTINRFSWFTRYRCSNVTRNCYGYYYYNHS